MRTMSSWRLRTAAGVLALLLTAAAPTATAATLSLEALLRLPFEQLLQVRIAAGGAHAR